MMTVQGQQAVTLHTNMQRRQQKMRLAILSMKLWGSRKHARTHSRAQHCGDRRRCSGPSISCASASAAAWTVEALEISRISIQKIRGTIAYPLFSSFVQPKACLKTRGADRIQTSMLEAKFGSRFRSRTGMASLYIEFPSALPVFVVCWFMGLV